MLVERRKSLVKDARVFDLGYTPSKVFVKEEMREVGRAVSDFIYGVKRNLFIRGPPGSGKTLSAKLVCREARKVCGSPQTLQTYYVKCSQADTSFKVISYLLKGREDIKGLSFGEGLSHLFNMLGEAEKSIVVLDDADMLKDEKIIYSLTRAGEEAESLGVSQPNVMLVTIAGDPLFEERLSAPTRSSFFPVIITFGPYSAREIMEILKMRAEEGLVDGAIKDSSLELLSNLVSEKAFGDLRVAILALGEAANLASREGKSKIGDKHVVDAFKQATSEVERLLLKKLGLSDLLILLACIGEAKARTAEAKKVYRTYVNLSKDIGRPALNYKSFHNHLMLLQNMYLIHAYMVKEKKGFTQEKVVEPLVGKHAVEEEVKKRVEEFFSRSRRTTLEYFAK